MYAERKNQDKNVNPNSANEDSLSLTDFAQEPSSGAWPAGWYNAIVVEGYITNSGYRWATEDKLSKDGASHNLQICFQITNQAMETRYIVCSCNYRLDDFLLSTLQAIKEVRAHQAGKKGSWGPMGSRLADLQRSSMALAKLGQLERAFDGNAKLERSDEGNISPTNLIGYELDLHLTVNEETGYNEVVEFAKLGERTGKAGTRKSV
jgi:hypothetical protein